MLTKMNPNDLLKVGSRIPSDRLLEQVDHTLRTASTDEKALKEILPTDFLDHVKRAQSEVNSRRNDPLVKENERQDADRFEVRAYHEAKVWRRQVAHRAEQAIHLGEPVREDLVNFNVTHTENSLASEVNRMLNLLERNRERMPGEKVDTLIQRGRSLCEALSPEKISEHDERLSKLPDEVKKFYTQKGDLYMALKAINDAGRELHAESAPDPTRYSLEKIYSKKK